LDINNKEKNLQFSGNQAQLNGFDIKYLKEKPKETKKALNSKDKLRKKKL
jgi:hypothetical protein